MTHLAPGARVNAWRDVLERSFWTALESAFAAVGVDAFLVAIPDGAMLAVVGFSTVLAFLRNVSRQRLAILGKA